MNIIPQVRMAPTLNAPVEKIRLVKPNMIADQGKCESYVNVGLFFDGTRNNYISDAINLSHSNIARLSDTYKNEPKRGYFKVYIPGVGTKFPEISEYGESNFGSGFGSGCEARVIYAMLAVINSLHQFAFKESLFFSGTQIDALCSVRSSLTAPLPKLLALRKLGLEEGLLMPDFFGSGNRDTFFRAQLLRLKNKLISDGKPKIMECFIDVFGFSRGAAEARVFCSWLNKLLANGKLAGVPVRFRFLGIMDTVASAGFWSSAVSSLKNNADGHSGWAAVEYLRLPTNLENCIHMVAMHEVRRNFPLDEAGVDGELPPNTQEIVYPGSHSDVGGGYGIGELGVSVSENFLEADALKLSQIPLNHMFECAYMAGCPMQKTRAIKKIYYNIMTKQNEKKPLIYDPFAIGEDLLISYRVFILCSPTNSQEVREWMQPYLNWRWQNRNNYNNLLHVNRASKKEKEILQKFNRILIRDADLIERMSGEDKDEKLRRFFGADNFTESELITASYFDKESKRVLDLAKNAPVISKTMQYFFDNFVHDSLAGFDSHVLELSGYWRYRKGFVGGNISRIVMNDNVGNKSQLS